MSYFILTEPVLGSEPVNESRKHGGLFYRAKESFYHSESSGVFHKRITLTPLKRKSCKGCPTCECIFEMVSEYGDEMEEFMDNLKKNNIYELKVVGDRCWTDCGYEYDSWLELKTLEG